MIHQQKKKILHTSAVSVIFHFHYRTNCVCSLSIRAKLLLSFTYLDQALHLSISDQYTHYSLYSSNNNLFASSLVNLTSQFE